MKKATLIIGPGGSGKTTLARQTAEQNGTYKIAYWDGLRDRFWWGRLLSDGPATVIIEGITFNDLSSGAIKQLIDSSEIEIDLKYQDPCMVPVPNLIFTVLTPQKFDLEQTCFSRFEVIQL